MVRNVQRERKSLLLPRLSFLRCGGEIMSVAMPLSVTFDTLIRRFRLFDIVAAVTRGLPVKLKTIAVLLGLFASGSVWAQQNPGQPGAIPMPAGPVAGTAPAAPPSSQQTGPVGAPSIKGPSPELRAAYDEAFKLSMQ